MVSKNESTEFIRMYYLGTVLHAFFTAASGSTLTAQRKASASPGRSPLIF